MSDKNRERDERANNKCIVYRTVDCYLKLTVVLICTIILWIMGRYLPPNRSSYKLYRPICLPLNGGRRVQMFLSQKEIRLHKKKSVLS